MGAEKLNNINISKENNFGYDPIKPVIRFKSFIIFNNTLRCGGMLRFLDKKHADTFFSFLKQRCEQKNTMFLYNKLIKRYSHFRKDNLFINLNNLEVDGESRQAMKQVLEFKRIVIRMHKYTLPKNVIVFDYLGNIAFKDWPLDEQRKFIAFCKKYMSEKEYDILRKQVKLSDVYLPTWDRFNVFCAEVNIANPGKVAAEIKQHIKVGPLANNPKEIAKFRAEYKEKLVQGKLRAEWMYIDSITYPNLCFIENNAKSYAYAKLQQGRIFTYLQMHDKLSVRSIRNLQKTIDEHNYPEKAFSYLDMAIIPELAKISFEPAKFFLGELYGIFQNLRQLLNGMSWASFLVGISLIDLTIQEMIRILKYGTSIELSLLIGQLLSMSVGPKLLRNFAVRFHAKAVEIIYKPLKTSEFDFIIENKNGSVTVITSSGWAYTAELSKQKGLKVKISYVPKNKRPDIKITSAKTEAKILPHANVPRANVPHQNSLPVPVKTPRVKSPKLVFFPPPKAVIPEGVPAPVPLNNKPTSMAMTGKANGGGKAKNAASSASVFSGHGLTEIEVIDDTHAEGVFEDVFLGEVPVLICKESYGNNIYLNTTKIKINLKTTLMTLINQIRSWFFYPTDENVSGRALKIVRNGGNKNELRNIVEKELFIRYPEGYQNDIIYAPKTVKSIEDCNAGYIDTGFTDKNLEALENALRNSPQLREKFIDLVADYVIEAYKELDKLEAYIKEKHGSVDGFVRFEDQNRYALILSTKYTNAEGNALGKVNKTFIPKFEEILKKLGFESGSCVIEDKSAKLTRTVFGAREENPPDIDGFLNMQSRDNRGHLSGWNPGYTPRPNRSFSNDFSIAPSWVSKPRKTESKPKPEPVKQEETKPLKPEQDKEVNKKKPAAKKVKAAKVAVTPDLLKTTNDISLFKTIAEHSTNKEQLKIIIKNPNAGEEVLDIILERKDVSDDIKRMAGAKLESIEKSKDRANLSDGSFIPSPASSWILKHPNVFEPKKVELTGEELVLLERIYDKREIELKKGEGEFDLYPRLAKSIAGYTPENIAAQLKGIKEKLDLKNIKDIEKAWKKYKTSGNFYKTPKKPLMYGVLDVLEKYGAERFKDMTNAQAAQIIVDELKNCYGIRSTSSTVISCFRNIFMIFRTKDFSKIIKDWQTFKTTKKLPARFLERENSLSPVQTEILQKFALDPDKYEDLFKRGDIKALAEKLLDEGMKTTKSRNNIADELRNLKIRFNAYKLADLLIRYGDWLDTGEVDLGVMKMPPPLGAVQTEILEKLKACPDKYKDLFETNTASFARELLKSGIKTTESILGIISETEELKIRFNASNLTDLLSRYNEWVKRGEVKLGTMKTQSSLSMVQTEILEKFRENPQKYIDLFADLSYKALAEKLLDEGMKTSESISTIQIEVRNLPIIFRLKNRNDLRELIQKYKELKAKRKILGLLFQRYSA